MNPPFPAGSAYGDGKMHAIQITSDHQLNIACIDIPEPQPDEVLLKPARAGLCGTDLHILRHGFVGTHYPVIPLHEFCGHVVKTGAHVRHLSEGDFVVVDPNVVDGTSRWCTMGRPNLCPSLTSIGVARPGAAAEYVTVPEKNAFIIDEALGHGVVALVEPLACALHALQQAQVVKDRNLLILGSGTMGLLLAISARVLGAGRITVVDVSAHKLDIARQLGADVTCSPERLADERFDVVFEATGVAAALTQALGCLEKTATLVQVGVHDRHTHVPLNPLLLFENEWRLIGSNSCADQFPVAVELVPDIAREVALLVGEIFPVWAFSEAVEHMLSGVSIKTQLSYPEPLSYFNGEGCQLM